MARAWGRLGFWPKGAAAKGAGEKVEKVGKWGRGEVGLC